MTDDVIITQEGHFGIITLNRPQALHALTLPMIRVIQYQLDKWSGARSIHAVIIQSSGGKAFCAGGDVRWLYEAGRRQDPEQLQFFKEEYQLNKTIYHYSKPYIALMDGITMGGGVGISLHGSHAVAGPSFVFAMPETSIGFFPDIGSSYLLNRCPGFLGLYLGLTGNRLNADESHAAGLVGYRVQAHQFSQITKALIDCDLSEDAFERVSACIEPFLLPANFDCLKALQINVDQSFCHGNVNAIIESLEEEKNLWAGEVLKELRLKTPLSIFVAFSQIKKAVGLDFDGCIQLDFQLVQHFIRDHDFYEGVRALLVDKDKTPHWNPADFHQVSKSRVDEYFS